MPHIAQVGIALPVVAIALLLLAGLALFVYNMFLASQGWSGMQKAKAQKVSSDAEFGAMQAKIARSDALRAQLKDRLGSQYASMIEAVDMLMVQASSMLMAGDSDTAMDLIDEACHEMENMLSRQAT